MDAMLPSDLMPVPQLVLCAPCTPVSNVTLGTYSPTHTAPLKGSHLLQLAGEL